MDGDLEHRKSFIINTAYFAIIAAIYFVCCRYVIYKVMPFLIAAIVMLLLRRPTDFVSKKLHIPRKGVAAILVLLFYAVIGSAITFAIIRIVMIIIDYITRLPDIYSRHFAPLIQEYFDWYQGKVSGLNPEYQSYVATLESEVMQKVYQFVSYISSWVISFSKTFITSLPGAVIGVLFGIISTVFMSMDYPRIKFFIMGQFSVKNREIITNAFSYLRDGIGKMILSYGLIMLITYTELNIGLRIIGIKNAGSIAILIAIFDILPALGTGGVVIPWVIITLVRGDFLLAGKLFILYVFITVVRNIIEPKIVGQSIGVHPVVMLMSIFLGGVVLGPLGIIILPFTIIIIKNLNDSGRINLFKSVYMPEPDTAKKRRKKAKKENENEQI